MDTHTETHVGKVSGEPLPAGYEESPARRCVFSIETYTGGAKGLAYAILLRAIEDGCDPRWLHEIADAYGIQLPPEMLNHTPNLCVRLNLSTRRLMSVDGGVKGRRLILTWEDALSPPKWMRNGNGWTNLRLTA